MVNVSVNDAVNVRASCLSLSMPEVDFSAYRFCSVCLC